MNRAIDRLCAQGMWWLPKAGELQALGPLERSALAAEGGWGTDLLQLAAKLRMNTDVRRAVFCTIMGSEDVVDASERLLRLPLKVRQLCPLVSQRPASCGTWLQQGSSGLSPQHIIQGLSLRKHMNLHFCGSGLCSCACHKAPNFFNFKADLFQKTLSAFVEVSTTEADELSTRAALKSCLLANRLGHRGILCHATLYYAMKQQDTPDTNL